MTQEIKEETLEQYYCRKLNVKYVKFCEKTIRFIASYDGDYWFIDPIGLPMVDKIASNFYEVKAPILGDTTLIEIKLLKNSLKKFIKETKIQGEVKFFIELNGSILPKNR